MILEENLKVGQSPAIVPEYPLPRVLDLIPKMRLGVKFCTVPISEIVRGPCL